MRSRALSLPCPFEVILTVVFGLTGAAQLVFGPSPNSSSAMMPDGFRILWMALILLGSVAILVGIYSKRVWGYVAEQLGLLSVGWSMIGYGVVVFGLQIQMGTLSASSALGGPLVMGIGIAYLWKRQQIWRRVRTIARAAEIHALKITKED